jgi:copper transport protein
MVTQGGSVRRTLLGMAVGAVTVVVALVAGASPAAAHAELIETRPANGEQLDAPPDQVYLRFNESVDILDDSLEVFDSSGDQLDLDRADHVDGDGTTLGTDLPALDDGAYVVTWRVGSADSHPIQGAFTFRVGEGDQAEANALMADLVASGGGDTTVGFLYGVVRFADFVGMVLLVGGALFVAGLWPAGVSDRRARRLLVGGWITVAVATLLSFGFQGAYTAGDTLSGIVDSSELGDTLDSRAGRVWLIRLLLLALILVVRRRLLPAPVGANTAATTLSASASTDYEVEETEAPVPASATTASKPGSAERLTPQVIGVLVLGLALLATISFAGHAGAGDLVPLALAADLVHLVSVAFWLGGLTLLLVAVVRRQPSTDDEAGDPAPTSGTTDTTAIARIVGEFSAVAFVAVIAIVVSGTVQGWRQVGTVWALTSTTYGRLLIAKVVLFALIMGGAYLSRQWARKAAVKKADATGPSLKTLRRSVGAEVVIAVVVLAVTALLVNTVPAEDAYDPTFSAEVHGELLFARIEVEPAKAGPADIVVDTLDHGGNPISPVGVTASLSQPGLDIGPLPIDLEEDGTGHWAAPDTEIPFAGAWQLDVDVRISEFDQETLSATLPVK